MVAGYEIVGVAKTATFNFGTLTTDPSWSNTTDTQNYRVEYADNYAITLSSTAKTLSIKPVISTDSATGTTSTTYVTDNAMLLPQDLNSSTTSKLKVKVMITTADDKIQIYPANTGEYGWMEVALKTKWEAGMKYTYVLNMTGEIGAPIKFTTTVNTWDANIDEATTDDSIEVTPSVPVTES